jgi:SsrA-binding protein
MMKKKTSNSEISFNRKATHDYFLSDFLEVGIVLKGTEIKSIRKHNVSLKDAYVFFKDGQAYIEGLHIPPYDKGNIFNHDPLRTRTLLMHKNQIKKYALAVEAEGYTCIPVRIYYVKGRVKLEIALAKGKKLYDKREALKAKEQQREIDRTLKANKYDE